MRSTPLVLPPLLKPVKGQSPEIVKRERQAPDEGARPAAETGVAPSGGVGGVSTDLSERVTGELRGLLDSTKPSTDVR